MFNAGLVRVQERKGLLPPGLQKFGSLMPQTVASELVQYELSEKTAFIGQFFCLKHVKKREASDSDC